jgi:nicotinamide riboside transporter PnuC
MFFETLQIVATALAVVGVLANNYRRRVCFALWVCSNFICLYLHVDAMLYGLAVRDAIFSVLAVHGWFVWSRLR